MPLWVPAIMLGLALIEPATHLWLVHAPPAGFVSTGLHTRETVFLRYWMRPFDAPSPFALDETQPSWGINAPRVFFGTAGALGRAVSLDDFTTLGWLNGLCMLTLLLGVYTFLRTAVPRVANVSFIVYALAGGLGGILYFITGLLGLHDAANFERYFQRYAHYELFQGKFLGPAPLLVYPHYTLPLGFGFAALALAIQADRRRSHARLAVAAILLFLGGCLNVRLGPMMWAIFIGYLIAASSSASGMRVHAAGLLAIPAWAAFVVAWWPIYRQSGSLSNQIEYGSAAVWFSPLITATVFHLITVPIALRRVLPSLPRWQYACAWAAFGYLALFTTLYFAHLVYYGTYLVCNDTAPPLKFSDLSLLGGVAGAVWALTRTRSHDARRDDFGWICLWFLAFLVFSISAFGRGLWLTLTPQRLMVFYGVPLAMLSAYGLVILAERRRAWAWTLGGAMIVCGACSIAVGAFVFRGPLGPRPGETPYGESHAELMRTDDAACIQRVADGFFLAPLTTNPTFGDVVAARDPRVKVFGVGSFGLSGLDYGMLEADVSRIYLLGTPESDRRAFLDRWKVDWVYVPATPAEFAPLAAEFHTYPWIEVVCTEGDATLFKVKRHGE